MENTYSEHKPGKFPAGCKAIIFSPTGGTKKDADILSKRLTENGDVQEIDLCDPRGSYVIAADSSVFWVLKQI
ncbi:MAG: hypothetical protein LUE29_07610 [Lachnospiraceae bacterium]|nr:hypothetical protein [Lachnospiraceae bacterium]